ncbi:olfactory receptor 2T11-like [Cavia porcellus]|uniref:olfactory receptor 2T11-like n=1 Tax=Cavia porcellus TaxID=10141 RepID=UPI002FE25AC9
MLERNTTSSSDFTLLGLLVNSEATGIIFTVIFAIFVVAVTANLVMIFLIQVDPQLHTPMYFLLSQLSIMDTLFICTTVPKLLVDMVSTEKTISFVACGIQIFLYLTMIGSEFFLLGLMAYDRYVAVCNPLRYPVLMNRKVCLLLAAGAWFGGSLDGFLLTPITMNVPYCGSRSINHFFCEIPAVLKLACADTSLYETLMYICCVLMLLIPISIISASYSLILLTVHRMRSAEGRKKAFTTCSSHLTVVSIFYGAAFYTYVLPQSFHTPEQDKVVSAFYTIVTPMLNPLIYSLRNKDVTGASRRIMGVKVPYYNWFLRLPHPASIAIHCSPRFWEKWLDPKILCSTRSRRWVSSPRDGPTVAVRQPGPAGAAQVFLQRDRPSSSSPRWLGHARASQVFTAEGWTQREQSEVTMACQAGPCVPIEEQAQWQQSQVAILPGNLRCSHGGAGPTVTVSDG